MSLQYKDLIDGHYYVGEWSTGRIIIKFDAARKKAHLINAKNQYRYGAYVLNLDFKIATMEEQQLLAEAIPLAERGRTPIANPQLLNKTNQIIFLP